MLADVQADIMITMQKKKGVWHHTIMPRFTHIENKNQGLDE